MGRQRFPPIVYWIPRFTGILSILGSSAIIFIIFSDRKRKLSRPKNRLMLLMSFFDVSQSASMALSSLPYAREKGIYGARGNEATCSVQKFFFLLGMAVPLYNASLNLLYLLMIRYDMNPKEFSAKIEPFLHLVSIFLPFSAAIRSVVNSNSTNRCLSADASPVTPETGSAIMFTALISFCFFFTLLSMISISRSVISLENNMRGYIYNSSMLQRRETVLQALLYSSAFFLTFIFPFASIIYGLVRKMKEYNIVLVILTMVFYPLQGFWNFVLYIRPGVKHVRKVNPEKSLFGAIREVIFHAKSVANSFRRVGSSRHITPQTSRNRRSTDDIEKSLANAAVSNSDEAKDRYHYEGRSRHVSFVSAEGKSPKGFHGTDKEEHEISAEALSQLTCKNEELDQHGIKGSCVELEMNAISMESKMDLKKKKRLIRKSFSTDSSGFIGSNEKSPQRKRLSSTIRRTSLASIASVLSVGSLDSSGGSLDSE